MLNISNKALNYVQGKNLCFVVDIETIPIDCDCCHTNLKTIKTNVLLESELLNKESYDVYEYNSVNVYVLKDLKIASNIKVYQKSRILSKEFKFGIKGITT